MTVPSTRTVVVTRSKTNSVTFKTSDGSRLTAADTLKIATYLRVNKIPKDAEQILCGKTAVRFQWEDLTNTTHVFL